MITIVCYDDSIKSERKFTTLGIKWLHTSRYAEKINARVIIRTNGIVTEKKNVCDYGVRWCKTEPCTKGDRYDYEQDINKPFKRNDKLMKDANNAYNLLFRKGYLCRIAGIRGWVRQLDQSRAKIVVNTEYSSEIIKALLELYFPNRRWEVI